MPLKSAKAPCIPRSTASKIEAGSKLNGKRPKAGVTPKFYSLTRTGQRQLTAETAGWKRLCDAISLVLEHVDRSREQ